MTQVTTSLINDLRAAILGDDEPTPPQPKQAARRPDPEPLRLVDQAALKTAAAALADLTLLPEAGEAPWYRRPLGEELAAKGSSKPAFMKMVGER